MVAGMSETDEEPGEVSTEQESFSGNVVISNKDSSHTEQDSASVSDDAVISHKKKGGSQKKTMKGKEEKKRTADMIFGYKKIFKDMPVPTTYQDILMREKVKRAHLKTKLIEQKLMMQAKKSRTFIPEDEE